MLSTWDTLRKELGIYGIRVISNDLCAFAYKGRKFKSSPENVIKVLKRCYTDNLYVIDQLFSDLVFTLSQENDNKPVDPLSCKLFIYSLKELLSLAKLFYRHIPHYRDKDFYYNVICKLRQFHDKDILDFSSMAISLLSDYKMAIDMAARRNSRLEYISKLLTAMELGPDHVLIKEARGIQGPWAHLDLPMKERAFLWQDVQEETQGREKSKKRQLRYRLGLDTYNKSHHVGEGFYWRDMALEPFSWDKRFEDSPYKQLAPGTWR